MIVESLSLANFMGYKKKCSLDFSGKKTISIAGPNETGKSSILQAISYGLYGRTRAERESQLISTSSSGNMVVEVAVKLHDGKLLEIERGRTRKNEPILNVSGLPGKVSDVDGQLTELLSLSYNDFISLSYFVQGDIHQFLTGNKREYFQRWTSGLKLWAEFEAEASNRCKSSSAVINENAVRISTLNSELEDAKEIWRKAGVARSKYQKECRDVDLLTKQMITLTSELKAAEAKSDLEKKLSNMQEELAKLRNDLDHARREVAEITVDIKRIAGGRCPLLNIACDDLKIASKAQREEKEAKLADAKERADEIEKRESALSARVRQLSEKKGSSHISALRSQLCRCEAELKQSSVSMRRAAQEYGAAKKALERIEQAKEEIATLNAKQKKLSAESRRWQFVRYMCSKDGIPALLVEQELVAVEARCNWVLDRLGYQKQIKFTGYKELAAYESVCLACGGERWSKGWCKSCGAPRQHKRKHEPTVTIMDGSVERPFALESGGAQVLESFAVRLACSLFVSSMTGAPMQMVMLDEIFAMLDQSNRQKLLSLVVDKLSTEFGLSRQFIVSHQEDVANSADHLIMVTRERGGSVARWE